MAIPDFQSLMLPLLRLASNTEVSIEQAVEHLSSEFNLTDDERTQLIPSQKQTIIKNRTSWARTYLAKAGLLQKTRRSHFKITDKGRDVLDSNISAVNVKYLEQFPEFQKFKEIKRQAAEWEKLFVKYITDKGIIYKM